MALLRHASDHEVTKIEDSPFGTRYVVEGYTARTGRASTCHLFDLVCRDRRAGSAFCNRLSIAKESKMIQELDSVVLATDLPEYGLERGDIGTVVLTHRDGEGYEVEFMTLDGETLAVVSLLASQVRPIGRREVAHARIVESV